jgi:hypothetical protein
MALCREVKTEAKSDRVGLMKDGFAASNTQLYDRKSEDSLWRRLLPGVTILMAFGGQKLKKTGPNLKTSSCFRSAKRLLQIDHKSDAQFCLRAFERLMALNLPAQK